MRQFKCPLAWFKCSAGSPLFDFFSWGGGGGGGCGGCGGGGGGMYVE